MIRITRFTDFKTNFEMDGRHYSLNQTDCDYESIAYLRCKETNERWCFGARKYSYVMRSFIVSSKTGATYAQRYNLNAFELFVREIISGKEYECTTAYKVQREEEIKKQIDYHLLKIKCLKDELERIVGGDSPLKK